MDDQKLLEYYLKLREPEAYQWNLSPRGLYIEYITRDFLTNNFNIFNGIEICNVGIGVGEWDDYLGFLLKDKGMLTSIDIDPEICSLFAFRQKKEKHPNPSSVICQSILSADLPLGQFDLVTIIGSTVRETGGYDNVFEHCFRLIKTGGYLMYMDFEKYNPSEKFEVLISKTNHTVIQKQMYDKYSNLIFYIYKIRLS